MLRPAVPPGHARRRVAQPRHAVRDERAARHAELEAEAHALALLPHVVTITRVAVEPGATQDRHAHESAEQIWLVEQGNGRLLLANGESEPLAHGDVIRTPPGEVHGLTNTGTTELIYISVTSPPQDFSDAYGKHEK